MVGGANPIIRFLKFLGGSENYQCNEYFRLLRHYEYHLNNKEKWRHKLPYYYYKIRRNHKRMKANIYVAPNTLDPGVKYVHPGFLRIDEWVSIGSNCTILPNVLFGKRKSFDNPQDVHINVGDNVYISTNVTILGPLSIRNNVIIGAGAVVTKDVPDNAVVVGVPAKIIRMN